MLYSAAARIARELGYYRILTYILATESGVSLRASGWKKSGEVKGREWDVPSRRRTHQGGAQVIDKVRYEMQLRHGANQNQAVEHRATVPARNGGQEDGQKPATSCDPGAQ